MFKTYYSSPLGKIILISDFHNLIGLWFEYQKYCPDMKDIQENNNIKVFYDTKKWLDQYFSNKKNNIIPPLLLKGSDFRQAVWRILLKIPYGKVTTYGEIAKKLSNRKVSARAIGGAVGHNQIAIIIPCHRVVGTQGLTGYAGGIDRKIKLLELEGISITSSKSNHFECKIF